MSTEARHFDRRGAFGVYLSRWSWKPWSALFGVVLLIIVVGVITVVGSIASNGVAR